MRHLKLNQKKTIGIDYSLNSPAICISNGSWNFNDCNFYYLTDKVKWHGEILNNIKGTPHKPYSNPISRFNNLSNWVFKTIFESDITFYDRNSFKVFLEGYSYGSKGQALFQIAENCGILKWNFMTRSIPYEIIPPAIVKKGATGKGNANKELMYDQFCKDTKTDLIGEFKMNTLGNPITDIVDAYYIAKCGVNENS